MDDVRVARRAGLRTNNFDLIRLVAALQVVFFHSVEHLNITLPSWTAPICWFPGVPIFFVLSGFLISHSYERNPDLKSYAAGRLLRIMPALWVCFLLSIASVLWIRPDCLAIAGAGELTGWIAAQLSIGQFFNPSFLRDYGAGVLNGSLWTIPIELQFYAVVPILYFALGLHKSRWQALVPMILIALIVNRCFAQWKLTSDSMVMRLFGATFLPHVWYFLVGILVQRNFGRLRSLFAGKAMWWLAAHLAVCATLTPLGWNVGGNLIGPLPSLTLIGVTFSLAYTAPTISGRLLRDNDISYGTYLYHMVIINALLELHWPAAMTTVVAVFALTIVCALLSWTFIEQPALALKPLFRRPAVPSFQLEVGTGLQTPRAAEQTLDSETATREATATPIAA